MTIACRTVVVTEPSNGFDLFGTVPIVIAGALLGAIAVDALTDGGLI
jgi:hypothetical protein